LDSGIRHYFVLLVGGGDQETGSESGKALRKEGGWGMKGGGREYSITAIYSELPKNVGLLWGY
jgi:uncharacterized protein (UPF0128 family)